MVSAVILTLRQLYIKELVIHLRVKLSSPGLVLCCLYSLAFRPAMCHTYPLAAG